MRHDMKTRPTGPQTFRPQPSHGGKRRGKVPWLTMFVLLPSMGFVQAAHAACPKPTLADLKQQPGFKLEKRWGIAFEQEDYVETDAGEVVYVAATPPTITQDDTWWDPRVAGKALNCPTKKSVATVTVEVGASDSTGWVRTDSTGLELELFDVLKIKGGVDSQTSETITIHETASVTQTISAAYCYIIPFEGKLRLGDYTLSQSFKVRQRYAWWTKNVNTGDVVHRKGDLYVDCGTVTITYRRRAALEIDFDYGESRCPDPGCKPVATAPSAEPPPPPPPPPTTTPPSGGEVPGTDDPTDDPQAPPEEGTDAAEEGDDDAEPESEEPETNDPEEDEPPSTDGEQNQPSGNGEDPPPAT